MSLFLALFSIKEKIFRLKALGILGGFSSYFVVADEFIWGLRNRVQRE